jgi:hypothetical protein
LHLLRAQRWLIAAIYGSASLSDVLAPRGGVI